MNCYINSMRPLLRQAMVNHLPGPAHASKQIAIVGLPRSGSSWLAKAIALTKSTHYYFEPDQEFNSLLRYPYIGQTAKIEPLFEHIEQTLKGNVHSEYTIAEQGFIDIINARKAETILMKWVRLPLSLEWIAENFPQIKVVQIIRHPVPLFISWQARSWSPALNLQTLLKQDVLMNGPLVEFQDTMRAAKTYWEMAGAFWGAVNYMQMKAHRPSWILKEHEWYCHDPVTRVRWLVEQLGLEWNKDIEVFLSKDRPAVSGPGYGPKRDSQTEITKWHGKISDAELNELFAVIEKFNLPFYLPNKTIA